MLLERLALEVAANVEWPTVVVDGRDKLLGDEVNFVEAELREVLLEDAEMLCEVALRAVVLTACGNGPS